MKKSIVLVLALLATTLFVIAEDSRFTSSLRSCASFTESGTINTEGMSVQSTKQIMGWDNDKCVYKETVNFNGLNVTTTCRLSKPQIEELASVMNAYALVQEYSNESVDTSKLSEVQNNPVVKAWNKYLQDSSVCTMTGLK
jgi:cell fate (sporulation/competence/biofilm development) regulator YmcA (YheA/YmcA/DUF963 family)